MIRLPVLAAIALLWLPGAASALPGGNQLAAEASPYLQSHAADAVHWRAWGPQAMAEAKVLNRPIFLSIGYLACHWCHVMQRESFASGESAALINELFVPVLIDREERPDLDFIYQNAAAMLDLPTGWPLTMFLSHEGQPFFGATYIPKDAGLGMPAFADVLRRVNDAYTSDPEGVIRDAAMVGRALAAANRPQAGEVTPKHRAKAAKAYMAEADSLSGGFGEASKFPNWPALMLLWRQHLRSNDAAIGDFVKLSLREMVRGGLYDHVGGGFFRYTTEPLWHTPHFEKMLDVNAGMVRLLTQIWRETKDPELEHAIAATIDFLTRELRHPHGAFISSLDADSLTATGEEHEGAFYRWREADIRAVLGSGAEAFFAGYAVAPLENAPGETEPEWGTLYRQDTRTDPETVPETVPGALKKLFSARAQRSRPKRDDKILADGNGLAIRALSEAGFAFGRPDWTQLATEVFDASIQALIGPDGRMHQSAVVGDQAVRRGPMATLSAITAMGHSAISLFEASGDVAHLRRAETWAELISTHHKDLNGPGFFADAEQAVATPIRLKPVFDDPNPAGNSSAVSLFARLYYHTGKAAWRKLASATLEAFGATAQTPTIGTAAMMNAADDLMAALQVVVIGEAAKTDTATLLKAIAGRSLPAQVLQVIAPGTILPDGHPAQFKEQIDAQATAYVCRGTVCSLPATAAGELDENLAIFRKDPR
ncbi:MAG: thioredoxin domain-containing protein [Rhodospirillaceae bacterium]|nr:thioredoxin domain-containing protein [Rhodospirillaceae bacterium]